MINVNFDISEFAALADLQSEIDKSRDRAAQDLSELIASKMREISAKKLKTRREMYQKGISTKRIDENTHFVILDAKVRWIDDGQPAYDMLKTLLNSPKAKQGKNGKYIVIPFSHGPGKGPAASTAAQNELIGSVKQEMKKRGIPFGKVETDQAGKALTGRLHSFDIMNAPAKLDRGKGQRRGPVGDVMQGNSKIPFLQGVSVYQNKNEKTGKTQRSIVTFRIASEKHRSQAKWEHPGNAPVEIMEEALKEAYDMWSKEMAPAILDKILIELK